MLLASAVPAWGEWERQTVRLEPGWNAVYLEVQPDANECDAVFGDAPVESVWFWNKRFDPKQFVRNPSELVPELPDWITWFPSESPKAFLTTLHAVIAGDCYLVQLGGSEPVDVEIVGRALVRKYDWLPDALNLVGFPVSEEEPPTFASFFSGDKALAGQQIYRITREGLAEAIENPAAETLNRGEAYWVYCKGESKFAAPLAISYDISDGLQFSEQVDEQAVLFTNDTGEVKNVTVKLLPSAQPMSKNSKANLQSIAGQVKLSYQNYLLWEDFEEPITFAMPPNSTQKLILGVRRADMDGDTAGLSHYAGLLEIADDQGTLYRVPVSADKINSDGGLWAGTVTLNMVSEAANPEHPDVPTPASGEFNFRLIVHVDESGAAKLLQHVTLMQVQPAYGTDGEGNQIVTTPSRYVLITDDSLLPQYEGVAMRDGAVVGRRITSPVFAFDTPLDMIEPQTDVLVATVSMDYLDPKNPFVHTFHPDHDNLTERFETAPLPEGFESFTFTRSIRLEFSEQDPEALNLPSWGYSIIGGTYRETITGVHRTPIVVEGTFKLTRVSDVLELNDGQ
ncbi:MAG: hypothetical protein GC168_09480 [Candidatus Hydrogenedens sp.]|nr:hypothetical protein [Candidatus Hydrogenedens sp.]